MCASLPVFACVCAVGTVCLPCVAVCIEPMCVLGLQEEERARQAAEQREKMASMREEERNRAKQLADLRKARQKEEPPPPPAPVSHKPAAAPGTRPPPVYGRPTPKPALPPEARVTPAAKAAPPPPPPPADPADDLGIELEGGESDGGSRKKRPLFKRTPTQYVDPAEAAVQEARRKAKQERK